MAQASDVVYLPVLPSMRGFSSALTKQGSAQAAVGGKTLGATMGKAMVVGIAAAAAGVAAVGTVLYQTGKTFDDVNNTIRVGTGATGKTLEGLNDVAKSVGQQVPAEFDKIAPVIADLNTRLGLSGDTLDLVARQYLEAGRILGEDVDIEKTSASFNAFGIEGEAVSGAMDHLFQVSQATGVGMNDLAEKARGAAPAAQALGLSFEETTGMVGTLEKAGLNSSGMMQQMSRRLGDLAEAGEEPRDTFDRVTGEIQNLMDKGDTFGAQELAGQAFGTRNAEQFMKAMEDGTLNMDELANVAGMTGDTILEAGQETMQFGEQWQLFKNNVMVWLEPLATRVFGAINDLLETAVQGVKDFSAAFDGGDVEGKMGRLGAKAREVFDYMENTAIPALKDFGGYITDTVVPALQDFGRWLDDNKRTIGIVAGVITAVMLPALVRLGVTSLIEAGKVVAAWAMKQAAAVRAGVVYVLQSIKIIGTWVAMSVAAVTAGLRIAAVWTFQIVRSAVVGAVAFGISVARVVAGWVLMGVQSMIQAARMAAAWFIALGPIGWVTAAVIAIAALVIANWDKIVYWTKKIWSAIVDWVVGAWENIRDKTTALLTAIVNWVTLRFQILEAFVRKLWRDIRELIVAAWEGIRDRTTDLLRRIVNFIRDRFNWVRDFSRDLWQGFRDRIVGIWESVRDNIVSIWDNGIKKPLDAMKTFFTDTIPGWVDKGADMIRKAWRAVQEFFAKPINWVINKVWNDGIGAAFNSVADTLNLPDSVRIKNIKEIKIPQYAKGGFMGDGWKLVGEEGPELINTGPGYVHTAAKTNRLLSGDVEEGQHVHPMGGNWISKIGSGLSSAWDTATGWVRGSLASMAEATFKPLVGLATTEMAKHGKMGELGGGLVDWGLDKALDWIRGKDNEVSANGEYEGAFTANPGGFNRPSQGRITSWGGPRNLPGAYSNFHSGIDLAAGQGAPVRAAWSGVVKRARSGFGTYGNLIVLGHGGFDTSYAHLSRMGVNPGQTVTGGQIIGREGATGRVTGAHLHFERHPGGFYNPGEVNSLFRDGGGPIYPGMNMVLNKTPHLERTFNDPQFQNLNRMAELAVNGGGAGGRDIAVTFNGVDMDQSYKLAQDFRRTTRQLERVGY